MLKKIVGLNWKHIVDGISITIDEIWFTVDELWFDVDKLQLDVNETRKKGF